MAVIDGGPPSSSWEATHSQKIGLSVHSERHPAIIASTSATARGRTGESICESVSRYDPVCEARMKAKRAV